MEARRRTLLAAVLLISGVAADSSSQSPPRLRGQPAEIAVSPRLVIRNGCADEAIWIASTANVPGARNVKILPGQNHSFHIPDDGLAATRFWPKAWCNEEGEKCVLGSSGGLGQDCPEKGCAPPVDSKFEATFGVRGVNCTEDVKGCDWWDTSSVDGYTLPYKLEVDEKCPQGKNLDCMALSFGDCPLDEPLGASGHQDLRVWDPHSGKVVGCYSPCGKLTYSNWGNLEGRNLPSSDAAKMYCCPTPPVSPELCRAGPVEQTQFVRLIHDKCPNVYGYAYDDAVGLQLCPSDTTYTWTLGCPSEPQP